MRKILILFISVLFLNSCQLIVNPVKDLFKGILNKQEEKKREKEQQKANEPVIIKSYYEKSRALKSEITVKNKKKNGPAKKYYPTGEIHTLVNYKNNIKVGKTIWYYKNGQPYRVTPYVDGKMHGKRTKYYEDGTLQAVVPYNNDKLQEGTKEYSKNGEHMPIDQKIIFEPVDLIKIESKFILKMKLADKSGKVEFFEEKTSTEGNKVLVPIKTNVSGTGKIEYVLPRGTSKMKVLKIFAKYKTRLRNPVMISNKYNLAIKNK